jgi:hypothetical protein
MEGHTGSNGLIYRNPQVKNYGKVVQSRWLRLLLCALTGMIHAQSVLAQTVTAGPGQTVEETGLSIVTNGANGVVAQGGTLTLHNSSVTTSGSGVAGLALLSDNKFSSMLTTTSSTETATGGAWGILIRGTTNRTAVNTITLESTEITTNPASNSDSYSHAEPYPNSNAAWSDAHSFSEAYSYSLSDSDTNADPASRSDTKAYADSFSFSFSFSFS